MKIITHVAVFKNIVNQKPQINSGVDYWPVVMGVEGNRTVEVEQVFKTVQQKSLALISNT
jgi:hypothetical protein